MWSKVQRPPWKCMFYTWLWYRSFSILNVWFHAFLGLSRPLAFITRLTKAILNSRYNVIFLFQLEIPIISYCNDVDAEPVVMKYYSQTSIFTIIWDLSSQWSSQPKKAKPERIKCGYECNLKLDYDQPINNVTRLTYFITIISTPRELLIKYWERW